LGAEEIAIRRVTQLHEVLEEAQRMRREVYGMVRFFIALLDSLVVSLGLFILLLLMGPSATVLDYLFSLSSKITWSANL